MPFYQIGYTEDNAVEALNNTVRNWNLVKPAMQIKSNLGKFSVESDVLELKY